MSKEILPEYLGDIDAELLLQNLTNINPHVSSIDALRERFAELRKRGETLGVEAEFEFDIPDDLAERRAALGATLPLPEGITAQDVDAHMQHLLGITKRFVRLVIRAG
jgi:hypothetical protein